MFTWEQSGRIGRVSEMLRRAYTGLDRVPSAVLLALAAFGSGLLALWITTTATVGNPAGVAAATVLALVVVLWGVSHLQKRDGRAQHAGSFALVGADAAACFMTNAAGQVIFQNAAAEARFGNSIRSLTDVLGGLVLAPGLLLLALCRAADRDGAARRDLPMHEGVLRLSVHRSAPDRYFWRIDEFRLPAAVSSDLPSCDQPPKDAGGADLEEVPVALMSFGSDGVLRSANRAARDLLWQGELRAAMFHDVFEGLGRPVSDWLSDVASGRLQGGAEVLRVRNAREETFLEVTLRRFVDGGRPGALAVLNDATRLKTLEAQFAQSQKMQAIGQLAGGIAHDFNNLLTAISGHCDLLLLRHGHEDPDFADLEQIRQNANRAAALVGQLLGFSRKQTLNPERLDLEEVLSDLTHLLKRLVVERVDLKLSSPAALQGRPLKPIRADRRQLEQVLINLVVNARDAMPQGGTIEIATESITLTEPMCRDRASVPAGDYTVIRVIDSGIGIADENRQKIFEPFFTTKRAGEGTGLGLSMVYGIIKQSGGFIFVDSNPGAGSTFSLYFPVFAGEMTRPSPIEPRRGPSRPGAGVVLLVEDEAPVRAFAVRALRLRGHTVLEAATGEEALHALDDPGLDVDLFVTDVVMPGLDGPAWVRKALERRPGAKVIFMSGYAEDGLSEDQSRIPNSVFLPKPFSLNDLAETVQAQLAR
ncbi:ATP-binding protein [Tabrizicola sp. YIM 78059]|uniref:hybrid sensor histidine kinase/response regulator n=1 Tax=Tabrizicola sp. YIM 78059 TaxID=2529861 RepID=UPI0020BF16C8|nr:ATP-binding protein [Tabrizicola sp. YIM 78059]